MATKKEIIIRVIDGQWYALQDGRHLTAPETAELIAKGIPYHFEREA